jgi:hypothetical protein
MADPGQAAQKAPSPEEDSAHRRIGQVIRAKWHLDSLLGVGGMAAVYASSHRNGQRAAIKILHADFARDKNIYERFLREAYVSNQINHPACVQVLDDDTTEDGEPYLVMQLLEGQTLRDLWWRMGGKLPVGQALRMMERVLDCLAACHAIGVIHRDLKPANIFVTNEDEVKVLDFGVAQMRTATAERTAMGTALGTPHYMSPEQAMGLVDQLDGRADIFSVGAMLHALITGERINKGRTEGEALVMAATKPVSSVARIAPDLPVEVVALVDKALAWDKRNRYAGAREMQSAVLAALAKVAPQELPRIAGPVAAGEVLHTPSRSAAPQLQPVFAEQDLAPEIEVGESPAPIDDTDARVVELRELYVQVDRLLPGVRQFGWDHPATERSLRTTFERFVKSLEADPDHIDFQVRPYSFTKFGHSVWEPQAPWDSIPYHLFDCGIRQMKLLPGLAMEELRTFLSLTMLDPDRDLPPEDDIATAFWERALPHVTFELADAFAEGDAASREAFWGESDELEQMAQAEGVKNRAMRLEAYAMAVSTDDAALAKDDAAAGSAAALEDTIRQALAAQTVIDRRRWSERYVDALVEGYAAADAYGEADLVLGSLGRSTADLAVSGRLDLIVSFYLAMVERLREQFPPEGSERLVAGLTHAMFRGDTLALVLRRLAQEPDQAETFGPILASVEANELPTVLDAVRVARPGPVLDTLLDFVRRVAEGREGIIAEATLGLDPAIVGPLLRVLADLGTQAAKDALQSLSESDDVGVRIEVGLLTESKEFVEAEVQQHLIDGEVAVRMLALRAAVRHEMKSVWPTLSRRVKRPDFEGAEHDEIRGFLVAMMRLAPRPTEPILLELATIKGGILGGGGDRREVVRAAATEVLGALSHSQHVAKELRAVSHARWGLSSEAKSAAASAADQIEARQEGG